jgi:hypothetical protein
LTEIARRLTIGVAALVVSAVAFAGQTPAQPAFEAASLKRNVSP